MLVIAFVLLTNIAITLGERRLQEEWATQRYSELQTVGTLIADKVAFQQFRTQMFAREEQLSDYLAKPSRKKKKKLKSNWDNLMKNIPELLGIALFDANGKYKTATNSNFGRQALPAEILADNRNMGGKEIFTSAISFSPIDGMLQPYIYQVAWLENPDQSIKGYLVTYNSIFKMLEAVRPAFANNKSPMLMLDTQGLLYAGARQSNPLPRIPETMGGSLKQSYPALWRKMAMNNFGQFHGDDATFVFLKIELTTQFETQREYFLVSYTRNQDIASKFNQWRNILVLLAFAITLLSTAAIVLTHLYRLEQRSRQKSIELANGLFTSDSGYVIVNVNGRIVTANDAAAKSLLLSREELTDRSLQRTLHQEDEQYQTMMQKLDKIGEWREDINLGSYSGGSLKLYIRRIPGTLNSQAYYLMSLVDVSDLSACQEQSELNYLLSDSSVAIALTDARGHLVRVNQSFDSLMQLDGNIDINISTLLENDIGSQWQRIKQHIAAQGLWQGQILCSPNDHPNQCMQATLKGQLDAEGELQFIVCTLEQAAPRIKPESVGDITPHRSAILVNLLDLNEYFQALNTTEREHASLLLIDISPEGMLSHMSDIGQLEIRQQEIETLMLKTLPDAYQISHWQLGKIIVILPGTDATHTHAFASQTLLSLNDNNIGEGVTMGIASYQQGQELEQFISNAEVALQRAKQIGNQSICQAFTRQT
ncbi:diguanylate cyclase [Shewanella gelidii]|uniref:Diguanylate cyclase n=2 Tax=Shewanella gelidii TaxID=1642821 RepID=A0A917JYA9_9GAMM|nr:diguanylate cyclase [Shewanella gelidii]